MQVKLIVGDWSHDGHEKTKVFFVNVKGVKKEDNLLEAYNKGTELVGFDLTNEVCDDYKNDVLLHEYAAKLVELGLQDFILATPEEDEYENGYSLDPDTFADIYMFICKLGNPGLKYEILDPPELHIGGYGLFY